jgi:hypothetical protein
MAGRAKTGTWRIAGDLKGRTLRQLTDIGVSLTFQCSDCDHIAVWPSPWIQRERKLQPLMTQTIDAFAPKLRCVACQGRCFFVRPFAEGDPQGRG